MNKTVYISIIHSFTLETTQKYPVSGSRAVVSDPVPPTQPLGNIWQSGDIFGCHIQGGVLLASKWVEDRDSAKHPTVHRTVPTTRR